MGNKMAEKRQNARAVGDAIRQAINGQLWLATAIVKEVRKSDRRIRVTILPEELDTNWIRVFYPLAGPDYMIGALPEIGTEVLVIFLNGDINHAYAIAGGTFYDDDNPPEITDNYDLIIKTKDGDYIKIAKSDGITVYTGKDTIINVPNGKTTINCDHVHLGGEGGGKVLTSTTFMPKYNADMALLLAHTNMIAPDPTLATIGNATEALHAVQKTDAE